FLEFMEGSFVALDSLRNAGLSINVHYFDTRKSPSHTRDLLTSSFFQNADLIVGPFYSWNVEIVNDFSLSHHVPLICPFYANDSLTASNPYLFQLNPSYTTEFKLAARYLAKDFDKNFVFIYSADSLEMNKVEYFKGELLNSLQNYTYTENAIIKEIVYDNIARANVASDLVQALSKDKKNIVVVPVTDEAFVSTIVSQLYFQLRNFDIQVFGMPEWAVFPHSDFTYYHKLNLTYITPYYYSFDDPEVENFLARFRTGFKAEPSFTTRKGCPYAFIGHDAAFAFLDAIRKDGNRFVYSILNDQNGQLLPGYRFRRKSMYGGFENQSLRVVHFHDDFTITATDVRPEEIKKQVLPNWRMRPSPKQDTVPDFR
ncbi:MAG TPA: ABC transporter substrate-binding protein, partial [Bacteroidales bacterium]|nr:ABC transporter substrate-binding protein [Bacteroidales bacterium]